VAVFEGEIPEDCIEEYQRTASALERFERYHRVDTFPRSSLGKVKKGELADRLKMIRPQPSNP
jgi:hypothetical protein